MFVTGKPKLWLRIEGFVLLISTILLFAGQHQKWWLYPALLLVPDIFMLGYLRDKKVGAFLYNIGHSYTLPALVIYSGWHRQHPMSIAIGLIWLGHIGWDRFFGYGLKYDSGFKDTHLGSLEKPSKY
jgi:hypothetical protein